MWATLFFQVSQQTNSKPELIFEEIFLPKIVGQWILSFCVCILPFISKLFTGWVVHFVTSYLKEFLQFITEYDKEEVCESVWFCVTSFLNDPLLLLLYFECQGYLSKLKINLLHSEDISIDFEDIWSTLLTFGSTHRKYHPHLWLVQN